MGPHAYFSGNDLSFSHQGACVKAKNDKSNNKNNNNNNNSSSSKNNNDNILSFLH